MRTNSVIDETVVKLQQAEICSFRGCLAWEGDLEAMRLDHSPAEPQP